MDAHILFDNAMGYADFDLRLHGAAIMSDIVTGSYGPSHAMGSINGGHLIGNFYGPNAEEIGGLWAIETDTALYANGDYNGKR